MHLSGAAAALLLASLPLATPSPTRTVSLPLVIWHGLGDINTSEGLASLAAVYQKVHSAPVHIIELPSDRAATFHGQVSSQLMTVCDQIASLPPPFSRGVNLLGLSQGGQFLRGLVQTCDSLPPVHTLMTFGSQHFGISKFLAACGPTDWLCKTTNTLLSRNKWAPWTQANVVPAQYFRDPADLDSYLENSGWLAGINNERDHERNPAYAERLAQLKGFVMYMFGNDTTVFPPSTAWFYDTKPEDPVEVVGLRDTRLYKEDWIGLQRLDKKGAIHWDTFEGMEHMRFSDEMALEAFTKYYPRVAPGWWRHGGGGARTGDDEL
ncbi:Alpha/Beta hydrolase protein [Peziza echinospora]|nr:Alpha/Beta hydrolase protein [Peziza echinospora]